VDSGLAIDYVQDLSDAGLFLRSSLSIKSNSVRVKVRRAIDYEYGIHVQVHHSEKPFAGTYTVRSGCHVKSCNDFPTSST